MMSFLNINIFIFSLNLPTTFYQSGFYSWLEIIKNNVLIAFTLSQMHKTVNENKKDFLILFPTFFFCPLVKTNHNPFDKYVKYL